MSTSYGMASTPSSKGTHGNRQIVGFSLSPERASQVKQEAARRGLSLKELFEELWGLYEKHGKKNGK